MMRVLSIAALVMPLCYWMQARRRPPRALVRKQQYWHRHVRGLPAQCFGRESWLL